MAEYRFPPDPSTDAGFLELFGPLVPVTITVPIPRRRYLQTHGLPADPSKAGYALIDTGATVSAVDDRVMAALEIPVLDRMETTTPHGVGFSNLYNASVSFPGVSNREFPLEGALGCFLDETLDWPFNIVMLLGRDLLNRFTVFYDGPNAQMTLRA